MGSPHTSRTQGMRSHLDLYSLEMELVSSTGKAWHSSLSGEHMKTPLLGDGNMEATGLLVLLQAFYVKMLHYYLVFKQK